MKRPVLQSSFKPSIRVGNEVRIYVKGKSRTGKVVSILPWGPPPGMGLDDWINDEPECIVVQTNDDGFVTHVRPSAVVNELNRKQKRAAKLALKAIHWFEDVMNNMYNDPMTHAMGVPTGDFFHDWSKRHIRMLRDRMNDPYNTDEVKQMLQVALEDRLGV